MPDDKIRGILAGVNARSVPQEANSTPETLDELCLLLETAGGAEAGRVLQNRAAPDGATFIGEGKVAELRQLCEANGASLVVFDSELSPSQKRVLENRLEVQVIDRSGLILDIFAARARTAEGKLQVELAQYKYLLPRLSGKGIELSRLGGGIGTRGPGETKLETDRRHIRARIASLETEISEVRRRRGLARNRREKNQVPVVSIVGYTNAGKSTLMNALCEADVSAADRLFETLDTTARVLQVEDGLSVILTDTVGFIRKLPHHLVDAFRATLEELSSADLILHVIDGSNPEWGALCETTERLIAEYCPPEIPRLRVFSKMDKAMPENDLPGTGRDVLYVSAKTGAGLDGLRGAIAAVLSARRRRVRLLLPYEKGGLLDRLYTAAMVRNVEYGETGISLEALCDDAMAGAVKDYIVPPPG